MRLVDEYEYVAEMRHYQALFVRYRHSPAVLQTLENRFGLRRVAESDPSPMSGETALQMSEWLYAQGERHVFAWVATELDLGAGNGLVYYLRAHATLELALAEINRLAPIMFPDARFFCETTQQQLRLSFRPLGAERLGVLLRYEAICVWMARVMQDITGGQMPLRKLELMVDEIPDTTTLSSIQPETCLAGAAQFSLVFSVPDIKLHLPGASEPLRTHLLPLFDRQINGFLRRNTVVRRVAQWLEEQPQRQELRLESAANALALGASTLRRQLAEVGSSFSDMVSSYRAFLAIHALIHEDEKSDAIAVRCGYADRNAFERAFRRWFAVSPAQCRKAARELLGKDRHRDWSAPSHWPRYSPQLDWLRSELGQMSGDMARLCAALQSDPVLQARLAGFCAMPSQGARTHLSIDPALLLDIENYALSTLVEGAVPCQLEPSGSPGFAIWQTSQLAQAAVSILAADLPPEVQPALQLAAATFNLGALVRPAAGKTHFEGIDISWLLLAAWHVPPSVLRLLRGRYQPEEPAEWALSLAIRWAESVMLGEHASPEHHALEQEILAQYSPATLEQLATII